MRRPRHKLQVSTFPFLAVLLGAMGALILLLLVMDRRSKVVARNRALEAHAARLAARSLERENQQIRDKEALRREWEAERQRLHELLRRQEQELAQEQQALDSKLSALSQNGLKEKERLTALEKSILEQRARLDVKGQLLAQVRAGIARSGKLDAATRQEAEKLARDLADLERAVQEAKALKVQERETYSLVPYRGKLGEGRLPVYVECVADALIFQPDGYRLDRSSFDIRAFRNEVEHRGIALARDKPAPTDHSRPPVPKAATGPYVLFLVRPDGMESYYNGTNALRGFDLEFGYELIDAQWVIDFSDGSGFGGKNLAKRQEGPPRAPGKPVEAARPRGYAANGAGFGSTYDSGEAGFNGPGGGWPGRGASSSVPGSGSSGAGVGSSVPGIGSSVPGIGSPFPGGGSPFPGTGLSSAAGVGSGGTNPPGGRPLQGGFATGGAGVTGGPGVPGMPGTPGAVRPSYGSGFGPPLASGGLDRSPGPPSVLGGLQPGQGRGDFPQSGVAGPRGDSLGAGPGAGGPITPSGGTISSSGGTISSSGGTSGSSGAVAPNGGPTGAYRPGYGTGTASSTVGGGQGGNPVADGSGLRLEGGANTAPSNPSGGPGGTPSAGGGGKQTGSAGNGGQNSPGGEQAQDPQNVVWRGSSTAAAQNVSQGTAVAQRAGEPGLVRGAGGNPSNSPGNSSGNNSGDGSPAINTPALLGPNLALIQPRPGPKRALPAPSLGRLLASRDFFLTIECFSDAVVVYPGRQVFAVAGKDNQGAIDDNLAKAVRQLIARRQATVRSGEMPYRPILRFQVHPDALRTYFHVYPLFENLRIPMTRENLDS